jgi:hypothetical protein
MKLKLTKKTNGNYLLNTNNNNFLIEKINQVKPNLWLITNENTNKTYGIFNTIKEFKQTITI